MNLLIIDYGSGNIKSLFNTLKHVMEFFGKNYSLKVSKKIDDLNKSDFVVLPGVGSFKNCRENLYRNVRLIDSLTENILVKKKPFLGICVGMQLFAEYGFENGKTSGLEYIEGNVKKIFQKKNKTTKTLKIPHIGWNNINHKKNDLLFGDIYPDEQFYFVHSYFFDVSNKKDILAYTSYGIDFPSIVRKDNILGFQFHPEKSGNSGQKVLINWLANF